MYIRSADQVSLLANTELGNTLIPALDNTANTNFRHKGAAAIARAVEFGAVGEGSNVVHGNGVTRLGVILAVTGRESLNFNTHDEFLEIFFLEGVQRTDSLRELESLEG